MTIDASGFAQANRLVAGKRSKFDHRFGGQSRHSGLRFRKSKVHLHLLYDLDLNDPLIPIKLPNATRLPLYCPFVHDGAEMDYQIISDERIRILRLSNTKVVADHPYENYPESFPSMPVSIEPISYDLHKTLAFAAKAEEDGISLWDLSDKDQALLKRLDWPFSFAQLGGLHWMIQGYPSSLCPDPRCRLHKQGEGTMIVFAVIWNTPAPGISLWGEYGNYVQIIYEVCPECMSIKACNQCD